jgi:hypothetical protein
MYCVYITTYKGNKFGPNKYIGSSSSSKIKQGYKGSVASKEYCQIWEQEIKNNPHLFDVQIVSKHKTRKSALKAELKLQKKYNAVKSDQWLNKSEARINGFFGMDVKGENNPMFGKSRKGEKHKGGENISDGLKKYYSTDRSFSHRNSAKQRMLENNPSKDPNIMLKNKNIWEKNDRNIGVKNGMYGEIGKLKGKKLYNNGVETKAFYEGLQPKDWILGRHKSR